MKLFSSLLLVTLGFAFSANAQQARDSYQLQDQAYQTYRMINDNAQRLSPAQISRVSQLLGDIQNEVYGGGYSPRMMVKGSIENREFSFDSRTLMDLSEQCTAFVKQNGLTAVDDIQVSINLKPLVSLRNQTGYWQSANQICGQIIDQARDAGLRVGASSVLTGSIENRDFKFIGNDNVDVYNQCDAFVKQNGLNAVDDISVSKNFQKAVVLHNQTGYWKNSLEICQQVMNAK